jgi:hypothetical protein
MEHPFYARQAPAVTLYTGHVPYRLAAQFPDTRSARSVARSLHPAAFLIDADSASLGTRENRFMTRVVLLVIAWSILGTAIGAALGIGIALLFGPSGTEGMIIQAVSWAIFAHLVAGMCAGYLLLAERGSGDLSAVRHSGPVTLRTNCATIDDAEELAARLRSLGATRVDAEEVTELTPQYQI